VDEFMSERKLKNGRCKSKIFLNAMVFFLDEDQLGVVEEALSQAGQIVGGKTQAARKAKCLTLISECYIEQQKKIKKDG
jgi:hypothetical protein